MALPVRFKGIDHLVLRSTDVGRTLEFYAGVLGLKVERIFERIGLHQIRCGANLIDIVPVPEGAALAPPAGRGIEHLCLAVEAELDELLTALAQADIAVVQGPMEVYGATGFGTSVYIEDPDGYQIELKLGTPRLPVRAP